MPPADGIDLAAANQPWNFPDRINNAAGMVLNTQSQTVRAMASAGGPNFINVLFNNIAVPAGPGGQYSLPVGTNVGVGGIVRPPNNNIIVPAGASGNKFKRR